MIDNNRKTVDVDLTDVRSIDIMWPFTFAHALREDKTKVTRCISYKFICYKFDALCCFFFCNVIRKTFNETVRSTTADRKPEDEIVRNMRDLREDPRDCSISKEREKERE